MTSTGTGRSAPMRASETSGVDPMWPRMPVGSAIAAIVADSRRACSTGTLAAGSAEQER